MREMVKNATIKRSTKSGKKYSVVYNGKRIDFGAKGYRIKPGTEAGNNYCTRSYGIPGVNNPNTANFWARCCWSCVGKKSVSKKPFYGLIKLP